MILGVMIGMSVMIIACVHSIGIMIVRNVTYVCSPYVLDIWNTSAQY